MPHNRKALRSPKISVFREFYFGCNSRHLVLIDQLDRARGCNRSQKIVRIALLR